MRLLCVLLTVALAAAGGGCSQSPEKVANDARQAAGSWAATLSAAAERWGSGELSTSYFQTVVRQARTSLDKETRSAKKAAGDRAAAPLEAVASHVDVIADAVMRGDRTAAINAGHAAASEVPAEKTPPVAKPQ